MKKYFCICVISIITFRNVCAQHNISIGVQAGLNMTSSRNSPINKDLQHSAEGLSAGGFIEFGIRKKLSIKFLPYYDQQNWRYGPFNFESGNGDILFHLHYINMPAMLSYSFGNKIQFHADAGAFGGLLLSSREILREPNPNTGMDNNTITKGDFKKINAGIAFSAGVKIPVSPGIKLLLDLRNYTGLTNIPVSGNLKLLTFSAQAGVSFKLK